jgi:YegS/Rv2252/BmrU family lipid kinase
MKHLFILNPQSFPYNRDMERLTVQIELYFKEQGNRDYTIHVSLFPRDAIIFIRKYMEQVPKNVPVRVYAVGGDGILFDCLNGIMGIPAIELAVLPYGTTNDFVLAFGQNENELFRNLSLQVSGPVIPTDVIQCGNNFALNFCSVGLDSLGAINALAMNKRLVKLGNSFRKIKSALYFLGSLSAIFDKTIQGQFYKLIADGEDLSGCCNNILIANGAYYGGNRNSVITAVPNDGMLDMLILKESGSFKMLRYLKACGKGKYPQNVISRRVKKVSISSDAPLLVNLDGEVFFDSDITIEIISQAVQIVTPNGIVYQRKAP